MEAPGTNLNMIAPLNNLTSESHNSTYTNLMEKVSHQTMNRSLNPQMKSQPNLDLNQKVPAKNSRNDMHLQLKQQLQHQEHQEPSMLTTGENPESYRSQTRTALASLLLAKNNNRPQQIWRLRLLQLQQQRLHSFLVSYHHHLFLMMASPAPATRKLSPPVFSLPNKKLKLTPPSPPILDADCPPSSGVEEVDVPSIFKVLNIFRRRWFLNQDHLIANILSAQKDERGKLFWVNFQPQFHTHLVRQALALLPTLCPMALGKCCMFVFLLEVLDDDGPGPYGSGSFFSLEKKAG
jgi:hypothetical protein